MKRQAVGASVLAIFGLVGVAEGPAFAQSRVVVPIVIQAPRTTPRSTAPSVSVTTQTTTLHPGVTTTRVTVQDTTGRAFGVAPTPRVSQPGVTTTHVRVEDTTGRAFGVAPVRRVAVPPASTWSGSAPGSTWSASHPNATATRVTVEDTTGRLLGMVPVSRPVSVMPVTAGSVRFDRGPAWNPTGQTTLSSVSVEDLSGASGRPGLLTPFALQPGSGERRTVTITSDAPIDAPIVILGP